MAIKENFENLTSDPAAPEKNSAWPALCRVMQVHVIAAVQDVATKGRDKYDFTGVKKSKSPR